MPSEMDLPPHDSVIVGAGFAQVAAARDLSERGYTIEGAVETGQETPGEILLASDKAVS